MSPKTPPEFSDLEQALPVTLTITEVANVLRMHERSIQRLVASGELRAYRSRLRGGSRLLFLRKEILRWFASRPARPR